MEKEKVLITTIQPISGGVPSMLKIIIDYLRQREYQVTLAFYQPYSISPKLSVPIPALFSRKPSTEKSTFYGCDCVGIGCWLPELEFTHYLLTKRWQKLIDEHSFHMMVSGSCLAAYPYIKTNTPFLAWTATDWFGDRQDRVKQFPIYRRIIDQLLVKPVIKRMEEQIISSGNLIALSAYTQQQLNSITFDGAVSDVLAMPIDTDCFKPAPVSLPNKSTKTRRIGFVGRFSDPRKNISLLLESIALIAQEGQSLELHLIGDTLSKNAKQLINRLAISDKVIVHEHMSSEQLANILPSFDVFVLPSFQEGLCIAAMEAMSCGVPVVSTRCGGPEMFIEDGLNGLLVDFDASELASAISQLLSNEELRQVYANAARSKIVDEYAKPVQERVFWQLFEEYKSTKRLCS